uniref:Cytochrome c oxidase subunit 4 n=1 Tax=Glossina brevipalpis TaxID=37001 RepID=A0A1A9WK09_9MUSC
MSLKYGKMLICYSLKKSLRFGPQLVIKRNSTSDACNAMSGRREYVGFGINGSPVYMDLLEYPMPSIRFREGDEDICALREKEKGDWRKLSLEEIKKLYRGSFCQTFAEIKAPTGLWKLNLGVGFWAVALGILLSNIVYLAGENLPETFDEDHRQAQLKRMIALEINPVTGLASKWDYETNSCNVQNKYWQSSLISSCFEKRKRLSEEETRQLSEHRRQCCPPLNFP